MMIGNPISRAVIRTSQVPGGSLSVVRTSTYIMATVSTLYVIAGVLAILVVRAIDRRQRAAYAKLSQSDPVAPGTSTANP